MNNQTHANLALVLHYAFKMLHPIGGIIAICLGYHLFVIGVTGQASISIDAKDIHGQLLNAAPGLGFAFLGLFVIGISAWRGGSVRSVSNDKETILAANERPAGWVPDIEKHPVEKSQPSETKKESNTNPGDTIEAIGPTVPFRYDT